LITGHHPDTRKNTQMAHFISGRPERAGRFGRYCRSGLFLLCAMLLQPDASAQAAPPAAPAAAKSSLNVALDDNYPPYIFRDASGALDGYLVDLWTLWESKTGVRVNLLASDWAKAQKRMQTHEADVIDTIFRTPERERTLDFTPPYAQIPVTIYTHSGIGGITGPDKLRGFLVGVKAGDACIEILEKAGVTTLQHYPSYEALVQAAISAQVRIFCLDEPPANYLLYRSHAEKEFNKSFQLYTGEFHRAVHKDDTPTMALLERGFAAISPSEHKALRDKWMGSRLERLPHVRDLAYTLLSAALISGLLLLWGAALRRQVRQRTQQLEAERTRLRTLLEAISDLVWMKDEAGVYRFCNPGFERYFGAKEADIVGKTDYDFVDREQADFFRAKDRDALQSDRPSINEEWLTFADDGSRVLVETTKTPVRDAAGVLIGVLGIARDITGRKQAAQALQESENRLHTILDSVEAYIYIKDPSYRYQYANRSVCKLFGRPMSEIVGYDDSAFFDESTAANLRVNDRRVIEDGERVAEEEINTSASGRVTNAFLSVKLPLHDKDGKVYALCGVSTDITDQKKVEEQIRNLAFYDPLTQLPNRRLLADRLKHALASSVRSGREGALLFIDLDNFKTLNDTLGHDKGDHLLQEVARRLSGCVGEGDTIARLGGDEFVVMLEDLSAQRSEAANQTEIVGEKILAALCRPYDLDGQEYRSSSSIGITLFAAPQNSIKDLMKRADLAMYQAKAAGRNTLRFFDPKMQAEVTARAKLEADLREGLRTGQFLLHYQPQIDAGGRIIGAEALVRWQHPERGLVSPAEFIPLAEETGLILPLGNWVLDNACRQLARWANDAASASLCVAVNVSAGQLHQADFVEQVLTVLEQTGANPGKLKLELTESLLLNDVEDVIQKMSRLKSAGVGFSLDDFGTGYSSLAYLKRLPLEQLKIDQSFVRDILIDPNDAAIARTVVALAQSLSLSVIAEGVETEAQRDFLETQGCYAYQGYLFSRPLPIEAFDEFLKATHAGCASVQRPGHAAPR
jgi:diguanylate cyclase (GGDEF)-like protein/PAS domain S-box-containing protein